MDVLVDREYGLELLEREYRAPGFRLVVVYGGRRVGGNVFVEMVLSRVTLCVLCCC